MKKIIIITAVTSFFLAAGCCGGGAVTNSTDTNSSTSSVSAESSSKKENETKESSSQKQETSKQQESKQEETTTQEATTESAKKTELNVAGFDELLAQQAVTVTETAYVVQDEKLKALYPDLLQATIVNGSGVDLKDIEVAYVAWDKNGLPVKLKAYIDFTNGSYIREVTGGDINLVPGSSYKIGFEIEEKNTVDYFKAIVVSWNSFDGTVWQNPYYHDWTEMYSGAKYSEELTTSVWIVEDILPESSGSEAGVNAEEEAKLKDEIAQQQFRVSSTKYVIQSDKYKSLYPDMLQAVVYNGTDQDIKDAVVAFVAWDPNGLPIKIRGDIDFTDGEYVKRANYADVNMIPGSSYGEDRGLEINSDMNVKNFEAIVVSYTTFDGTKWENPLYKSWCDLYKGKKYHE